MILTRRGIDGNIHHTQLKIGAVGGGSVTLVPEAPATELVVILLTRRDLILIKNYVDQKVPAGDSEVLELWRAWSPADVDE